ncbi:MAG TPA: urease accessory protein UreD, partial [Ferruginibacter sp.]|nr:urease accessory protein UreD [Ferruginibacter sp.]
PLKVANITEDKKINPLQLMLMSSSPGILDTDEYDFKIDVEKDAALQLHTQAYQRIFHMKQEATQQMQVKLADGASFVYLPHPTVPHEQSSFTSRNFFYLGNGCRLVYGEILTCGRKLNGEQFLFTKYHSISQVYLNDKLLIKENLLMMPALINVHAMGQLESYTHQASFIYLQEEVDMEQVQLQLSGILALEKNMVAGISALPINGLIIRLLGTGAEQLYNCLLRLNDILPTQPLNKLQDAR